MYLMVTHVPIHVRGKQLLLSTDWKRSLQLLRDSLSHRLGNLHLVAPSVDVSDLKTDQALEVVDQKRDEIYLTPSFSPHSRAREYWIKHRSRWLQDVGRLVSRARMVHSGLDDCYRPIAWDGYMLAVRQGKPTVFVQDTDHVGKLEAGLDSAPLKQRVVQTIYKTVYERLVRQGVAAASLSLLKGMELHRRYARYARNARNFQNTSYLSSEIVGRELCTRRASSLLRDDRPVRFVYCGRLEARKGIDQSLTAIAQARRLGANVTLDIIGDGAERGRLEAMIRESGCEASIRFHGHATYGPELIQRLGAYDALLFTPLCEDTPRMIFDGYAAGLPLVAYDIPYVVERGAEEQATITCPSGSPDELAQILVHLDSNRHVLAALGERAHAAAAHHAADVWYKRRADWTLEAVDNHSAQ